LHIFDTIRAIHWQDNNLVLLDQRYLPLREEYLVCSRVTDAINAIHDMVVRGAPAIGITAAYAVVLAAREHYRVYGEHWQQYIEEDLQGLSQARPTAVNLGWAIAQMRGVFAEIGTGDPLPGLLEHAQRIHQQDIDANKAMGKLGAGLIDSTGSVLTHCNTGSLATGGYGTALGVIRHAYSEGRIEQVFADETRPWLQGSRLTAWELVKDNIPVSLIADSAAAHLMHQGNIRWVIVGADRIAANGDVANKIGTYSVAICARYHQVKFMVVAPTTTIDMNIDSGEQIPIETRDADELLEMNHQRFAAQGSGAWNPVFDVTPASLIDAIVTEKGIVMQPDNAKMQQLMAK
jgi:methylthioribose-1-phosphate isomerase